MNYGNLNKEKDEVENYCNICFQFTGSSISREVSSTSCVYDTMELLRADMFAVDVD